MVECCCLQRIFVEDIEVERNREVSKERENKGNKK